MENKQKNSKSTNMQTNSPPKLDPSKHTCIFHYHTQSMNLPLKKTNRIPTFHLDLSPPFCHVLTKTTQSEGRQQQTQQRIRENRELKEHKTIQLYRK